MAIFLHKPILGNFTIVGPLIWYDNPQVRLWMISNINNNDFHHHHLGKSQICAGADHYFSPSKPHSGKLWENIVRIINLPYQHLKRFGYWQLKNMLWKISYFICTVSWLVKKTGEIFFFFRNVFKINPCEQDSNFKRTSSQNIMYESLNPIF